MEAKDYNNTKVELIRFLMKNGAMDLEPACASTILFYSNSNLSIDKWNAALSKFESAEMSYYLCSIVQVDGKYLEHFNQKLNEEKHFYSLVDIAKSSSNV